jgi:hypothetical protein
VCGPITGVPGSLPSFPQAPNLGKRVLNPGSAYVDRASDGPEGRPDAAAANWTLERRGRRQQAAPLACRVSLVDLAACCGVGPACAGRASPRQRSAPLLIHIQPDSAVHQLRAFRVSLHEKPTVSQTASLHLTTSSYSCALQAARGGTRPPGYTCRIRRITTLGRALRACGLELDDMNAFIAVARPPWRA